MMSRGERETSLQGLLSRMPPPGQSIVASSVAAGWDGVHAVIVDGPIEGFFDYLRPIPDRRLRAEGRRPARMAALSSLFAVRRPGRRRADHATRRFQRPAHQSPDRGAVVPDRPGPARGGSRQAEWQLRDRPLEVLESFNRTDEDLWNLGQRLAALLRTPITGSRLYAEALQTQIAIHLLWNYSSLPREGVERQRLGGSSAAPGDRIHPARTWPMTSRSRPWRESRGSAPTTSSAPSDRRPAGHPIATLPSCGSPGPASSCTTLTGRSLRSLSPWGSRRRAT